MCWCKQTLKSGVSNYFTFPVWDTLHNYFSKTHQSYPLKRRIHWLRSSVKLLPVPWHEVSPATEKMRHIQLAIPCEKSGVRSLLNTMTGQQRIWFSRVKQGNSKTVLPLFIGCSYKLHSLWSLHSPFHFCTNKGVKKTTALLMTTLVHPCSVSQAKMFVGKTVNNHLMKECT